MSFREIAVLWRSDVDANTFCIVCQKHNAPGVLEKRDRVFMVCNQANVSKCDMGDWKDQGEYEADVHQLGKEIKHAKLEAPSTDIT
jgi:hypothetical protein